MIVVRVARGTLWVEGLAPPVVVPDGDWVRDGAFTIDASPDEELGELRVTLMGTVRGTAQRVDYEAILTSVVPDEEGMATEGRWTP